MKRLVLLLLILMLASCDEQPIVPMNELEPVEANSVRRFHENPAGEFYYGVRYSIVVIDSCEYIFGEDSPSTGRLSDGIFLTHKGNCKFCQKRNAQLTIEDLLK